MKMIRKKLVNPIFGRLQIKGKLIKLNVHGSIESTFIVHSSHLVMESGNNRIQLEKTEEGSINRVIFQLDGEEVTFGRQTSFSELFACMEYLSLKGYWENDQTVFLFYTFIRISVSILATSLLKDTNTVDEAVKHFEKEREMTTLLVQLLESAQIEYSSYVVNQRAKYLLRLGLNPKEKYEGKEIREAGKKWMRLTHPDTEFGDPELFKQINEATTYLSK